MSPKPNDARERAGDRSREELLTAFYAALNDAASNEGPVEVSSTDGPVDAASSEGPAGDALSNEDVPALPATPSWVGPDAGPEAVLATVFEPVLDGSAHVQALPERFVAGEEAVVAIGSFVGVTTDGTEFEVPFVHVYEVVGGSIRAFTGYSDRDATERAFGAADRS